MAPTRNVVLTDHPADLIETWEIEDSAKLAALRKGARIGIADIEAGRFVEFGTAEALERSASGKGGILRADCS
jgi:purine nucleoside permease